MSWIFGLDHVSFGLQLGVGFQNASFHRLKDKNIYGLFRSLKRKESKVEGMILLHLVWTFLKLVRGKGIISHSPCLELGLRGEEMIKIDKFTPI